MVVRGVGAIFTLVAGWVAAALMAGIWLVDTHVAAYMGICNEQRQEGTCLVDMRRGHVVRFTAWAAVNSDWLADAPQAVFTGTVDGHVYRYDRGQHIQLTHHPERNTLPRWSPDGAHIAYTRVHRANDIDLYVMNADGSNPRPLQTSLVSLSSAPVWSPDSTTLAYFTQLIDDNTQIWRLTLNGDDPFPLGTTVGNDASWSPDGKQLVFTGARGYTQIIVDAHTGETLLERASAPRPDVTFGVAWSPDGDRIAYVYQQQNRVQRAAFLEMFNVDSGETTRLLQASYTMQSKPHWADAAHLLQPVYEGTGTQYRNAILLINIDSGRVRRVPVIDILQFIGVVAW